jgi:hypothetical protein
MLVAGHATLLAILHYSFGINIGNEGDKFLSAAADLSQGNFSKATAFQHFNTAYIAYLSVLKFFHFPDVLIVFLTYLLSLFSYFKFHQLLSLLINPRSAKIWMILICFSPIIQYWQLTLFSESFFISISLLLFYAVLFPGVKWKVLKILLLSAILVFTRPSGIFTVTVVLLLYANLYQKRLTLKKIIFFAGTSVFLLFTVLVLLLKLHYEGVVVQLTSGAIYYGFPIWNQNPLPPGTYTLYDCYKFMFQQQGVYEVILLFLKKTFSFFVLTRPYYSLSHNLINATHYFVYFLAVLVITRKPNSSKVFTGFFASITVITLLNAVFIGIFFNEWSERYTVTVMPFLMVYAAYFIATFNKPKLASS